MTLSKTFILISLSFSSQLLHAHSNSDSLYIHYKDSQLLNRTARPTLQVNARESFRKEFVHSFRSDRQKKKQWFPYITQPVSTSFSSALWWLHTICSAGCHLGTETGWTGRTKFMEGTDSQQCLFRRSHGWFCQRTEIYHKRNPTGQFFKQLVSIRTHSHCLYVCHHPS